MKGRMLSCWAVSVLSAVVALFGMAFFAGCGGGGGSTSSPPSAQTVPATPANIVATAGAKKVVLSWTAVAGATSYNIYWSTAAGVTRATGTKISTSASPYTQSGLADSTTYHYVVCAVNAVGESPSSVEKTATTAGPGTQLVDDLLKCKDLCFASSLVCKVGCSTCETYYCEQTCEQDCQKQGKECLDQCDWLWSIGK